MAQKISNDARGLVIGDNAVDKVGFHGAAAVQRSNAAGVALTDSTGGATSDATLAAIGDTSSDASDDINDNFAKIAKLLNELRATLVEKGLHKGS
jgi:hypothetical protein